MTEKINGFTIHLDYYSGQDLYCDGAVEKDILEICKGHRIEEALLERQEWPVLYHLSKARENLLEWYSFQQDGSLLEIGSGCGALTGLFCRKLKRVVGVELSRQRSLINAYKNGEDGQAEIYVGNFEDIKIAEQFDYVTLIGVLEYAASYLSGESPYAAMLEKVRESLKPDGRLILAIENKMGLKYWAGAAEDHTGKAYDGLSGYAGIGRVRTFARGELIALLERSGYGRYEFYYPMPDYKLPNCIYSDRRLPKEGELRSIKYAYAGDNYEMFDEHTVADMLCKENLFPSFANSFLVIAQKE